MPGLTPDQQFDFAAALFPEQDFYQNVIDAERLLHLQDIAASYGGSVAVYSFGKEGDTVAAGQRLIGQPPAIIGEQAIDQGYAGVQIYADKDVNMWEFLLRADSSPQNDGDDTLPPQGQLPPSQA